jgi:hypothetical protein
VIRVRVLQARAAGRSAGARVQDSRVPSDITRSNSASNGVLTVAERQSLTLRKVTDGATRLPSAPPAAGATRNIRRELDSDTGSNGRPSLLFPSLTARLRRGPMTRTGRCQQILVQNQTQ